MVKSCYVCSGIILLRQEQLLSFIKSGPGFCGSVEAKQKA